MDFLLPNTTIYPERQNISDESNFSYEGIDPNSRSLPKKFFSPGPTYFICRTFVITALLMYACFFNAALIYEIITLSRRTMATPELAEQFLFGYNVEQHHIIKDEHYWKAIQIVADWFRPSHLIHPVHFTDLRWYPWNLSTNAERPFSTRSKWINALRAKAEHFDPNLIGQKRTFHNLYNEIFTYSRNYIHKIKEGIPVFLHPMTIHVKPAIVFDLIKEKLRTIFGVPKPVIFSEAMFHWPLFSHYFTHGNSPLLWNYETLNGGMSRLNAEWHSFFRHYQPVFSLDWSEFDMHVYFDMWSDCRQAVKSYFCFCGCYCPTTYYPYARTSPHRLHNLWNWIEYAYFNMPLVSPLGNVFKRKFAGMPSGIFCTQFWDSFYNSVMVVTVLLALGEEIAPNHFFKCMGDDVLFGLLRNIPISEWANFLERFAIEAKRRFNSKVSAHKSHVSQTINDTQILGYFNWNGWPVRSDKELLAALLNPKSLRDEPSYLMARSIGIYYASAGSPKLRPICKHIYDELKFQGIEPDSRGLNKIFGLWDTTMPEIILSHFPSMLEATCRLSRPSSRNPDLQAKYWNREHFTFDAGYVPCTLDDITTSFEHFNLH
jgi:hypothetical protein